jgi:hypothetical protein
VNRKLVHGTQDSLARALDASRCSTTVNTAFMERQNGTDRNYKARKVRKTLEFSNLIVSHLAVAWWVMLCYNFHHLHRGLRQLQPQGKYLNRTPAMAAGLADHPLSVTELLATQIVGFDPSGAINVECFDRFSKPRRAP